MSKLETNTIDTISGSTNLTLGGTNATDITIPSGVTITNNGTQTGFGLTGWSEDGANNNLLPANASAGIYLGVNSATAANLLDDYEEGTWTPAVNAGVTSPTYSLQSGSYTKIGRMVYFNFDIRVSGGTLVAGDFILEGLPFNNSSNAELADGGASFIYTLDVTTETGKNLPTINLSANNDIMNFYGVDGLRWLGTDMQNNTFIIIASGCYQTD
jgi:hypothetical protein